MSWTPSAGDGPQPQGTRITIEIAQAMPEPTPTQTPTQEPTATPTDEETLG